MTDQELDNLMRRVLMDAIRKDEEDATEEIESFIPSRKHQRQMKEMLKDPLKWMRNKTRPVWKMIVQKVAVVLLIASVSLGGVMAISPTVRAAVIQWVTEWYETHIVYRYFSEQPQMEDIFHFTIQGVPQGYEEVERVELPSSGSVVYEAENGEVIYFDYAYMHQGSGTFVALDGENVENVTIAGMTGQCFLSDVEGNFNTLTWIDEEYNVQFIIDCALEVDDLILMAESVRPIKK